MVSNLRWTTKWNLGYLVVKNEEFLVGKGISGKM
jgi:hypothetical protein